MGGPSQPGEVPERSSGQTAALEYQRGFSALHPSTMFDERGRLQKARKTVAVILDAARAVGLDPSRARLLDIGCSTGILTRHYAEHFGEVVGVDIDEGAVEWARVNRAADNVEYRVGDSLELPFADGELDLVTCTHIYEHVPDPPRMLDEIFRVLRPGGLCYFAAENRLRFWDGHYDLPLLTVMPRPARQPRAASHRAGSQALRDPPHLPGPASARSALRDRRFHRARGARSGDLRSR
jgi:SAM-dependent methyltransferase